MKFISMRRKIAKGRLTMFTEALEGRQLFSTAVLLSDHTLLVNGTPGNDSLYVYQVGTDLQVTDAGLSLGRFRASQVSRIQMNGLGGDDRLEVSQYKGSAVSKSTALNGGLGNDTLVGGIGHDSLSGGPGIDWVSYGYRSADLNLSIDGARNDGPVGSTTDVDNIYTDVENILGGSGNDTITGSNGDNFLDSGGGNDHVYGLNGSDWIVGGTGNDFLYGDGGSDVVSGGDGDDFVSGHRNHSDIWDNASDFLFGGAGHDVLVGYGGTDHYNSNDDGARPERDELYVSFGAETAYDRIFSDGTDAIY
jgi:Ca2+-binding RTX toxin-like protein